MFIYPDNLKAKATLWLWQLRDVAVIGVAFLLSFLALAQTGTMLARKPSRAAQNIHLSGSLLIFIHKFFISSVLLVIVRQAGRSAGSCRRPPYK